jgi:Zn-dependent metalloprotease
MCLHHHPHDPLLCVLSPDMLDNIQVNGNKDMRRAAERTGRLTDTMRIARLTATAAQLPGAAQGDAELHRKRGLQRQIFNAKNDEMSYNDRTVRREGDEPSGDPAVDEAYDGLGDTYDFYLKNFDRKGIGGDDKPLMGVVHYGKNYDNAYWDGHQMTFGDGDGRLFNRFTCCKDVIGHELSHGVTETTLGLPYYCSGHPFGPNPGALNESISDCMGVVINILVLGLDFTKPDSWLVGKGLLAKGVDGVALRSMWAPGTAYDDKYLGKDNQPDHIGKYVVTRGDSGGVHTNSGIPNVAFCRTAVNLGDPVKAATVLYHVLKGAEPLAENDVPQDVSFVQWASAMVRVAEHDYGADGRKAAVAAWASVGLLKDDGSPVA